MADNIHTSSQCDVSIWCTTRFSGVQSWGQLYFLPLSLIHMHIPDKIIATLFIIFQQAIQKSRHKRYG